MARIEVEMIKVRTLRTLAHTSRISPYCARARVYYHLLKYAEVCVVCVFESHSH